MKNIAQQNIGRSAQHRTASSSGVAHHSSGVAARASKRRGLVYASTAAASLDNAAMA